MNRRSLLLVAVAILISLLAIYIGWKTGQGRRPSDTDPQVELPVQEIEGGVTAPFDIFFPGRDGRLHREQRELQVESELTAQVELVLAQLLEGPVSEDLYPPLPPEMSIGWIYINDAGVVYLDLSYTSDKAFPAWGSGDEMLAVFSVVNSVLACAPEIGSVVLLRNGRQQSTFAGHLDTTRPLLANERLVAGS